MNDEDDYCHDCHGAGEWCPRCIEIKELRLENQLLRKSLEPLPDSVIGLRSELKILNERIDSLKKLLPKAFDAGGAHAVGSHKDFVQTHASKKEWVRKAFESLQIGCPEETNGKYDSLKPTLTRLKPSRPIPERYCETEEGDSVDTFGAVTSGICSSCGLTCSYMSSSLTCPNCLSNKKEREN